jgi:D-alanyl-D-alanine carboxypeptidase
VVPYPAPFITVASSGAKYSGWIGHNGQISGYFTFEVYNPELNATIVIAMNSDKKVNGEQGINVLLRDISKILFHNNPVNVPVIK